MWAIAFFNADLQLFGVDVFGAQSFTCRDVLSPVRSGAVTFCLRRARIWLCCTRHGLFVLTNFCCRNFCYRRLTCTDLKVINNVGPIADWRAWRPWRGRGRGGLDALEEGEVEEDVRPSAHRRTWRPWRGRGRGGRRWWGRTARGRVREAPGRRCPHSCPSGAPQYWGRVEDLMTETPLY